MLFEYIDIRVLNPVHEYAMRGSPVYLLNVKCLSLGFCLNSATTYQFGQPGHRIGVGVRGDGGGVLPEGPV